VPWHDREELPVVLILLCLFLQSWFSLSDIRCDMYGILIHVYGRDGTWRLKGLVSGGTFLFCSSLYSSIFQTGSGSVLTLSGAIHSPDALCPLVILGSSSLHGHGQRPGQPWHFYDGLACSAMCREFEFVIRYAWWTSS